jgi:hypothetical protein
MPEKQTIIDLLNEQLKNAIALGDKRKRVDLQHAIEKTNYWFEHPETDTPDLSIWGIQLATTPAEGSKPENVPPPFPVFETTVKNEVKVDERAELSPAKVREVVNEMPSDPESVTSEERSSTEEIQAEPIEEVLPAEPQVDLPAAETLSEDHREMEGDSHSLARPRTSGQLIKYFEGIPEDLSAMTNAELAEKLGSLEELESTRESYSNRNEEEWDHLVEVIGNLTLLKQSRLKKSYKDIETTMAAGDISLALQKVHEAKDLSEDDPKLEEYLRHCVSHVQSEDEVNEWRRELKQFDVTNDQLKLKKIIDRLRIPYREGRFPDDLNEQFLKAEEHLEVLRRNTSIQTSRMRLGSLSEKKKAYDYWKETVGQSSTVFDGVTDQSIANLIQEAKLLWEDESRIAMRDVFKAANQYMPADPEVALSRLEDRVGKPEESSEKKSNYAEEDLTDFNEFYSLILQKAKLQREARRLISESDLAVDAFEKLQKYIAAKKSFPDFENIDQLIRDQVPAAVQAMLRRIRNLLEDAERLAEIRQYRSTKNNSNSTSVESCLLQAEGLLEKWPNTLAVPQELKEKAEAISLARKKYQIQEQQYLRLQSEINEIRNFADNGSTPRAFVGLERIKNQEENRSFADEISKLQEFLDSLRSTDDQVAILNDAVREENPDWKKIYDTSSELLRKLDRGSGLYKKTEEILAKADVNLSILRVKKAINDKNIDSALEQLAQSNMQSAEVQQTLSAEIAIIKEAEAATPEMSELLARARKLFDRGSSENTLHALRLYRYVAGLESSVSGEENLPAYHLSKVTWEAMSKTREIESQIQIHINEIRKAKLGGVSPTQLAKLFEYADLMRKADLLGDPEHSALCEWVEEESLGSKELILLSENKFEEIEKLWQGVIQHNPVMGARRLLNAKIICALKASNEQSNVGDYQQALEVLNKIRYVAKGDPRFDMALSETLEKLNRFDQAREVLDANPKVAANGKSIDTWAQEYHQRREQLIIQKRVFIFTTELDKLITGLRECQKEYDPSNSARRVDSIQKASEISDAMSNLYHRIRGDEEVCRESDFLAYLKETHTEVIHILQMIFGQEERVDQASALNLLIFQKAVMANYPLGAELDEINKTIKKYIQSQQNLVVKVIDNIKARPMKGKIQQLIIQRDLWIRTLAGFLSADVNRNDKTALNRISTELRDERTIYQRALVIIRGLQEEADWKNAASSYEPGAPLSVDEKFESMNSLNLSGIVEIDQLNQKYDSWKKTLQFLSDKIQFVGQQVNSTDGNVIKKETEERISARIISSLKSLDQVRAHIGEVVITTEEYSHLYEYYSPKVSVFFSATQKMIVGWEEVSQALEDFVDNIIRWRTWGDDFMAKSHEAEGLRPLLDLLNGELPFNCTPEFAKMVETSILLSNSTRENLKNWVSSENYSLWVKNHPTLKNDKREVVSLTPEMVQKVPLSYRNRILEDYSRLIKVALNQYVIGPDNNGIESFPRLSNFANNIYNACKSRKMALESIVYAIEQKWKENTDTITMLGGYPAREELLQLQRAGIPARDTLKARMEAAEKIGPSTADEYNAYYYIYVELHNNQRSVSPSKKKPSLKDIFDDISDSFGHG